MVCQVFKFLRKIDNSFVYLNGDDNTDPNIILKLYIDWYNNDYVSVIGGFKVSINDFTFVDLFCPIDFYDETRSLRRFKYV